MKLIKALFVFILFSGNIKAQTKYLTRTGFVQWTIMQNKRSYNVILNNTSAAFILDISSGELVGQLLLRELKFDESKIFTSETQKQQWKGNEYSFGLIRDFLKCTDNIINQFARISMYETTDAYPKLNLAIRNIRYSKSQSNYTCNWDVELHNKHKIYPSQTNIITTYSGIHISSEFIIDASDFEVNISHLNEFFSTQCNDKIKITVNSDLILK